MPKNGFDLLRQREIIDILIGDTIILETDEYKVQMPYLSGDRLCEISTRFGLSQTYTWGGGALSRWAYMDNLLEFMNKKSETSNLLNYLFDRQYFKKLLALGSPEDIIEAHQDIVSAVLKKINSILIFGHQELQIVNGRFLVTTIGKKFVIEAPKVMLINIPYIQELRERCKEDLLAGNFDSVITKSRTLIEEVLIYILEKNTIEIVSKGDLNKLYSQVKSLYNMHQNKGYDGRVNSLLSGLEKIVQSIAEMRNMNSDAHGVGSKRIDIREHEALLVVNSAITFSEYILSVYYKSKDEKEKVL